ncbi:unnamed protein product [Hydatigera taeniaeformis]|uniref:PIG-P domain-containing protein n=1 Tax=Hydatigena taeniaeformis TaxID=6205 RepID=A0A0R3WTL9_HYDTA|nr:unnamed protein product [Hydatigera taeniaeformis]
MTIPTVPMRRYKFTLPKSVNTPGPLTERAIQGFVTYVSSWLLFGKQLSTKVLFSAMRPCTFLFLDPAGIYLIWAYVPHRYLHNIGITYLPSRWWAIVIPWGLLVVLFGGVGIYLWMNRHLVHPLSSINLVCGRSTR